MAGAVESIDVSSHPICDYCGCFIDELQQQCPALDDGRCRP